MGRYAYLDLAREVAELLPPPSDLRHQSEGFWTTLEVDAREAAGNMDDPSYLARHLGSLGVGGLRTLSAWLNLDPNQSQETLIFNLAQHLRARSREPISLNIILLTEFLYRRRPDAIETIADLLLDGANHEAFKPIYHSRIDVSSRRFLYTLLVFVRDPRKLRQMMLYESAERAGYGRYVLKPRQLCPNDDGVEQILKDNQLEAIARLIKKGADHLDLNVGEIDAVLEKFESTEGGHQSRCYEVFHDEHARLSLVFIFRYLRPWYIQQVQDVVFGDQAELIVLRLFDEMRTVDAHATSTAGLELASAIAAELFEERCLEYRPDPGEPEEGKFTELLEVLADDQDPRLRLQEVFIDSAPLIEAPRLILRCEQDQTLKSTLLELSGIGLNLLADPADIHRIGIGFNPSSIDRDYFYRFSVYSQPIDEDEYYLTYTAANIATAIRAEFEQYLERKYGVIIVPGTTTTHRPQFAA